MPQNWFKKGWKAVMRATRRMIGISTPLIGVQLSAPAPDTSFSRAQDEPQLMDEIWLLAGSEAYIANDGTPRLQKMAGQSRLQVIEDYFAENPELRRWADRNIEAATCAAAVAELREKKERFRQARLEQLRKAQSQIRNELHAHS